MFIVISSMRYCITFWIHIFSFLVGHAQSSPLPTDTLSTKDIRLHHIDHWRGNTFIFNTLIADDSVYFVMPQGLAKGYYEAYYDGDSNRLALTFYNYGRNRYCQQYYKDGSMKSDTEYDQQGLRRGVHVLYDRQGNEIWYGQYSWGRLHDKYYPDYLDEVNYSAELIANGKAWGSYLFDGSPSRGRYDRIILNEDSSFVYQLYNRNTKHWGTAHKGQWQLDDNLICLTLNHAHIWQGNQRCFILTGNQRRRKLELIEYHPWGLDWYHSEYRKE